MLSVVLLAAFAQAPPPPPPVAGPPQGRTQSGRFQGGPGGAAVDATPAGEPGSIQGRVYSAAGNPLKRTTVFLRRAAGRGQQQVAVTDPNGNFAFSAVEPGEYRLSADRPGFVRHEYGQKKPGKPGVVIQVAPRQELRDLVMQMTPGAVITGRVIDEDGERMPNVRVSLLRVIYQNGRRRLVPGNSASTNDLGEYRLHGIAPGRYYLAASASMNMGGRMTFPGLARASVVAPELSYGSLFYPNSPDSARSVAIEIAAGMELQGIDFNFQPVRTVRLTGTLAGFEPSAGRGGNRPVVMLSPRGDAADMPNRHHAEVNSETGAFEIRGVIPGSYVLVAMMSRDRRQRTARMPIEVGSANIEGIQMTFPPEMDLAGRVRVEGQDGTGGVTGLRVMLEPVDGGPMVVPGISAVQPDGSYRISNLAPDEFRVDVMGLANGLYVKSVRAGNIDITEGALNLSGGSPPDSLDIVLGANGGRVNGAVINDRQESADGAAVVLVPEGARRGIRRFYKTAVSQTDGRFEIAGIPPGDYKLFAWDEIEPGAYSDPAFLQKHEAQGATVRIREGAAEAVSLRLLPAE
jgi:protocatechuate 3,4-dioxygenase beta subunit